MQDDAFRHVNKILSIVRKLRPAILAMENVPELWAHPDYQRFAAHLRSYGYTISGKVCQSEFFGVPQKRARLIILAALRGEIRMPDYPNDERTVRQAIGKLEPLEHGGASEKDPLHRCSKLSETNLARIRASIPGGTWRDWPEGLVSACHRKKSGRSYDCVYSRLQWDRPASTITTNFIRYGCGRFGHPAQDRAISLREGALLQGFPDYFQFCPKGETPKLQPVARMIGNAVPPPLAMAVGEAITRHLIMHAPWKRQALT